MLAPRCIALEDLGQVAGGGKAEGLAFLRKLGLSVPEAFVVVDARLDALPDDLFDAYARLGRGRVAVRSSALGEDSAERSFAGQHETLLGVDGEEALADAVRRCLASAVNARATAYRRDRDVAGDEIRMSVVVQRMVEARAAGVTFTVDPASGRRDRAIVDVVAGLGEALVSGHARPDHYSVDRAYKIRERELASEVATLDDETIVAVARAARAAEDAYGSPLDLEWAVDSDGALRFLQARPVTELVADPRELDYLPSDAHVYTRCNVSEIIPGAVTPLTWSLSARGIDYGLQWMYREVGALRDIADEPRFVAMFFGHLFLDLSAIAEIGRFVAGASAERSCVAICGRPVPEVHVRENAPWPTRAGNGAKYARLVFSSDRCVDTLEAIVARIQFPAGPDARAMVCAIREATADYSRAFAMHLGASTRSGAFTTALLDTIAKGRTADERDHAEVARLLAGASDVESHDLADGLDRIADRIAARRGLAERFVALASDDALVLLRSHEAGDLGAELARYLERHGHRSVRELELRQKEWSEDPLPLIEGLRAAVDARLRGRAHRHQAAAPTDLPFAMRRLVALAHDGVRVRERAKSLLVRTAATMKRGIRVAAAHLVVEGRIPDEDLVYFFTLEELEALVERPHLGNAANDALVARARARRDALPWMTKLEFDETFRGTAEPRDPPRATGERHLTGKPVSRGVARGRARVAKTLEDARHVEPGEILIATITDVGWTPCFSVIAGIATDIGSAVSHGAVVAREYGIPAVVGLERATHVFSTGDRVVLDADLGILKLDETND